MKAWLDPHLHLCFHYEPQLSRKHLTPSITTETPLVLLWLQAKYKLSDTVCHITTEACESISTRKSFVFCMCHSNSSAVRCVVTVPQPLAFY